MTAAAQTNWKNVGNWHWIDKNCKFKYWFLDWLGIEWRKTFTPPHPLSKREYAANHNLHSSSSYGLLTYFILGINWAKEYFKRSFEAEASNSRKVSLTLETVTGDCDLNQRKSQIISIFDMAIKGSWKVWLLYSCLICRYYRSEFLYLVP